MAVRPFNAGRSAQLEAVFIVVAAANCSLPSAGTEALGEPDNADGDGILEALLAVFHSDSEIDLTDKPRKQNFSAVQAEAEEVRDLWTNRQRHDAVQPGWWKRCLRHRFAERGNRASCAFDRLLVDGRPTNNFDRSSLSRFHVGREVDFEASLFGLLGDRVVTQGR